MNILTDKILLFAILLTFIFFFQPWFPGDILLEEKPVSAIQMLLNLDDVDIPFLPSYNILRMVLMVPLFSILILLMLYLKLEPKSVRTYLFFLGFICMSVFLYLLDLAIEYYAIAENFSFMEAYGFFVTWFLFGVMLISVVISQMRKFEHFLIIGAGILFSILAYNIITVPFFQSGPFCYLADNLRLTGIRTLEHLRIVLISISIAILSGVPIGIYISRHEKIADVTLYITSIIITIPSIALFGFMMPILSSIDRAWDAVEGIGIGTVPAVIALALYSQLPIIRNTYIAIKSIEPSTIEAGNGMGMTRWQLLLWLQLPLAAPIIMAGIRTAVVMNIAIAAIAAFIGAGGLGLFVAEGLQMATNNAVITGAISMGLLAVIADNLLGKAEEWVTPEGLKTKQG